MGRVKNYLCKYKLFNRYFNDIQFKTRIILCVSLVCNLAYAVWEVACGAYYKSVWFSTFGCYYIMLVALRVILFKSAKNSQDVGSKRYLFCAAMLLIMNVVLIGIIVLVVHNQHNVKPFAGYFIYLMAAYTFTKITVAIVNFVRYRRNNNMAITAAKAVSLVSAVVTMLSLAMVMILQFGGGEQFLHEMTISLGAASILIISAMAGYMIAMVRKHR